MRRFRFLKVFFGLLGVGALFAAAGCHRYCRNMSPEERSQQISSHVADKLDLTEAQRVQFQGIIKEALETHQKMRADRSANLASLIDNVKSDELNTEQILAIYRNKRDTIDNFVPVLLEKLKEFHKTLDAKQKGELVAILEKFKAWHD